ncbi:hypothetical protein ACFWVC_25520 [Streptomyces sp. NPDC058691]|uniref:hypothetical protein n=1 Tax=Streptomyces sp. NPDC058691 TaxID=3346601 RepID=UPI003658B1BA
MSVIRTWGPRAAAAVAVALLGTACGGQDSGASGGPVALERIGRAIGCTPQVQTDVDELRQGACSTERGAYVMVTFASAAGQKSWLEEAQPYGGSYLVGERWVVEADPDALEPVRKELGGRVEEGQHHAGHHPASAPSASTASANG